MNKDNQKTSSEEKSVSPNTLNIAQEEEKKTLNVLNMRREQLFVDSVNYFPNSQEKLGLKFKLFHSYDYPGEEYVYRSLI